MKESTAVWSSVRSRALVEQAETVHFHTSWRHPSHIHHKLVVINWGEKERETEGFRPGLKCCVTAISSKKNPLTSVTPFTRGTGHTVDIPLIWIIRLAKHWAGQVHFCLLSHEVTSVTPKCDLEKINTGGSLGHISSVNFIYLISITTSINYLSSYSSFSLNCILMIAFGSVLLFFFLSGCFNLLNKNSDLKYTFSMMRMFLTSELTCF